VAILTNRQIFFGQSAVSFIQSIAPFEWDLMDDSAWPMTACMALCSSSLIEAVDLGNAAFQV
jgi:hypothetical protein